jgi:preprotein translocase subunit SecG
MELVLLVVQIIVALLLIGSVLVQRSDSDGMGLGGSGGGGGLLSSRGQANLMTRTTAVLAFIFMSNSLLLGVITANSGASALVDAVVAEQPKGIQVPKDGVNALTPQSSKDEKSNEKVVHPKDNTKEAAPEANTPAAAPVEVTPSAVPTQNKTPEAPKAD